MQLYNGDCLEIMKNIADNSVDMILCDLPYGVTDFEWDLIIPTEKLFDNYRRICKQNANVLLFCQQPFTETIISKTYKSEFSHMLVWIKNTKTRAKSSKTVPLAQYEEIAVFRINKYANKQSHKNLRDYFTKELKQSGFSVKMIEEKTGNRGAHHFFRYSSDFRIPTEEVYKKIQEVSGAFYRPYKDIFEEFQKEKDNFCTYNPPKDNTNIIFCNTPNKNERFHPTQKPVLLCERLISTYSNEGETVLDNCMGSGTTGVACKHLNRNFIGIELDEGYFNIAKQRIEKAHETKELF